MEVADDAWASLLPADLLLDILRLLETTAVIRCAGTCKPWRRIIIRNASSLRPCPDRYNPNLLGFFHHTWHQGVTDGSFPLPPVTAAVDTPGHCESERLPTFVQPVSAAAYVMLTSREGFLLLGCSSKSLDPDHLCLCNPLSGDDCTFFPSAPLSGNLTTGPLPIIEGCCKYVLLTGYDLSSPSGTRDDDMAVPRILAMAGGFKLCTEEDRRLTYQVFSGGSKGVWGPVQRSEVNEALRMLTYGGNLVVGRDAAVHLLAGTGDVGCHITHTVGLDVYTGRSWVTELPEHCQFEYSFSSTTPACALTTTGDGRPSLLQPVPDHHIQVWVLDSAMEWTIQHKIWIGEQILHPDVVVCPTSILGCNYLNVVCPRSGLLFIMLPNRLQLRIDLRSGARQPVQSIGKRSRLRYHPYEMDWSTYVSKMKNF